MTLTLSEADLQRCVVEYATFRGWLTWHDYDSRRNQAGFPDLVMVKHGRVVFAELKSDKGRLRPEQHDWMSRLRRAGELSGGVEAYVWRPADWPTNITRVLG